MPPIAERNVFITEFDLKRLKGILGGLKRKNRPEARAHLHQLEWELERATVVSPLYLPDNIITMNSRFRIRIPATGEEKVCTLVFPAEESFEQGRISILSLLGSALIGHFVGDTVRYEAPAGPQEIRIEEILYQPEASGDYHL